MTNKERFLKLVSNEKTDTLERIKERIRTRAYRRMRTIIDLNTLTVKDILEKANKNFDN